jgi:hypothetical protein
VRVCGLVREGKGSVQFERKEERRKMINSKKEMKARRKASRMKERGQKQANVQRAPPGTDRVV